MSHFIETFTEPIKFKFVPHETEFMMTNGQVWCKTSPGGATKVNWPGAGNMARINGDEVVKLNHLDVPDGYIPIPRE